MRIVHALRHDHAVHTLCQVLQVPRSTYYKQQNAIESYRTVENQGIKRAILELHARSKQRLGVERMQKRLEVEYGIKISVGRVSRLMRTMALPQMSTSKPRFTREVSADTGEYHNHLKQQFNPDEPNAVWVSDITFIKVNGRFYYVCAVIDLFARKLIAYSMSDKANTQLCLSALETAYRDRGRPSGVLFHSDRGVQYTARDFRRRLDELQFTQSFSAKGHPYDNAVAEAFFKSLKREETDRRSYRSDTELMMALFEYMRFYNHSRPHSANGGKTPDEVEEALDGKMK